MSESTPPERAAQKTVRFLRSYRSWNRGVEAGFPILTADELIARGVAVDISHPTERKPLAGRVVTKG